VPPMLLAMRFSCCLLRSLATVLGSGRMSVVRLVLGAILVRSCVVFALGPTLCLRTAAVHERGCALRSDAMQICAVGRLELCYYLTICRTKQSALTRSRYRTIARDDDGFFKFLSVHCRIMTHNGKVPIFHKKFRKLLYSQVCSRCWGFCACVPLLSCFHACAGTCGRAAAFAPT
jgi:hypothetical protein